MEKDYCRETEEISFLEEIVERDYFRESLAWLLTLACCASWFALSWMFILGFEGLNPVVAVVFWIIFGFGSIAGLIDKPGGKTKTEK